jgi:hypothetical protein
MEVVQIGDVTTGKKMLGRSLYTTLLLEQKTETQITVMLCRSKNVNADGGLSTD